MVCEQNRFCDGGGPVIFVLLAPFLFRFTGTLLSVSVFLSVQLKDDPNIVIAKSDATANDYPPFYEVRG